MSSKPLTRKPAKPWEILGQSGLDRVARGLAIVLAIAAGLLVLLGDHATVRVQAFSWQGRTVGAENTAFLMTFNRPMDIDTVAENLTVTPPLPGKISWAGRRMAYTLDAPIPYGETFEVALAAARDRFADPDAEPNFEPFVGQFRSRDQAFAYIGSEGEEKGRLVLVNLTRNQTTILTPPNLAVADFEPYPLGDRLLFSATDTTTAPQGSFDPALYTVATGLSPTPPEDPFSRRGSASLAAATAGTLTPVLPADTYQNLAFDLAPNGQTLVVQRVNKADPADFGPWVLPEGQDPYPLQTEPGGEFLIAPDSETLLMLQGQGTAIIPLTHGGEPTQGVDPLDFLPEYGRVFDLTSDGTTAAMVDFNQNNPDRRYTETLVLVDSQGRETALFNATGSIMDARFDPTNQVLYVLSSTLLPGEDYREQPAIAAVVLDDQTVRPLLELPAQSQATLSLAPDGIALLFSLRGEVLPGAAPEAAGQIWLLPLFQTAAERLTGIPTPGTPVQLPYVGLKPTWLP